MISSKVSFFSFNILWEIIYFWKEDTLFELMTSTFFSISANIDNIPIGLSYGIKKVHISIFKNIINQI